MCGIAGILGVGAGLDLRNIALAMANHLTHRGPDSGGIWVSQNFPIALSHRRLSILDPTPSGHQPMMSASGRYIISFNGEIYNHKDLRTELNSTWVGNSDTETILASIEKWGLLVTLKRCNGMFAFALWDNQENTITLARDRFGEKPLYYSHQKNTLIFSSELKALGVCQDFKFDIDFNSVEMYLTYGYISAPKSIYKNIFKIPASTYITFSFDQKSNGASVVSEKISEKYWSREIVLKKKSQNNIKNINYGLVKSQLKDVLRKSVSKQMISDVPLGAYLSGGIDSTLIVSLMQEVSDSKINTFTVGFLEKNYDESYYAAKIAKHLGVYHHELILSSNDVLNLVPSISMLVDEPFSDVSIIPTYLISKYSKEKVDVVLSGDGGDELFGGYSRYLHSKSIFKFAQILPRPLRKYVARSAQMISPKTWDEINNLSKVLFKKNLFSNGNIVHKGARLLNINTREDFYLEIIKHWDEVGSLLLTQGEGLSLTDNMFKKYFEDSQMEFSEQMMSADIDTYLHDDILVKLDRASMAASLEARAPFLDLDVYNLSCELPIDVKIREGKGKWILRELIYDYVPRNFIERPKTGFGVPIGDWLRGPLSQWAYSLLDEKKIKTQGIFNAEEISKKWKEHLSGKRNWDNQIWNILMFQVWFENNKL